MDASASRPKGRGGRTTGRRFTCRRPVRRIRGADRDTLAPPGRLTLTSGDDGQLYGRAEPVRSVAELSRALHGLRLVAVDVTTGTADLTLDFSDVELQVLSNSSGYKAWQVHGPARTVAVGQGGGNIVVGE